MNQKFWDAFEKEANAAQGQKTWGKNLAKAIERSGDTVEGVAKGISAAAMKTPRTALVAGLLAGGLGTHAYHRITKPSVIYG